ncbi:MAG: hypothetical protein OSJ54_05930 [Oscillospiraceae bacterium]|nr:hypothetical protein [Oscillospiraceae bacterium]
MEKKVVTEKREVLRYVADDGTEFKNEKDCQNYETRINRENLLAALEKIERADLNMAPPGTSYVDTERYSYVWFRPQNRQEINTINAYFGLNFDEKHIGDWIGVEVEGDYDDYDNSSDCWTLDYREGYVATKEFFEALGYKVLIEPSSNYSKEKDELIHFASSCEDYEGVVADQLRALWTAFCIHENLDVDTNSYDNALNEVWCALTTNNVKPFSDFNTFDRFMCKYLV